jgi:hypothetical protein
MKKSLAIEVFGDIALGLFPALLYHRPKSEILSMKHMLCVSVALGLIAAVAATSKGETVAFNATVADWSSSTVSSPATGIYPIGGSGQVNGGFVVGSDAAGNQIGLRAELRNFGPVLGQTNDGVETSTYIAPPGGTTVPNRALWNFDYDIDLRASGHTISDYVATLTITDGTNVDAINLVSSGIIQSNAKLFQDSENPGFAFLSGAFPAFNPNAIQNYGFDLSLTPTFQNGQALEVQMNVDVAPLPGIVPAAGFGMIGFIGFYAMKKRRLAC